MTSYALAVDVGGTFTDAVLISSAGGCWTDKALTTHEDIMSGFFCAADLVLKQAGIPFSRLDDVITHATTVITNLLIERKGGNCALITQHVMYCGEVALQGPRVKFGRIDSQSVE